MFSTHVIKGECAGLYTPSPELVGHSGECCEGDRSVAVLKTKATLRDDSRVRVSHSVVVLLPVRVIAFKLMNSVKLFFTLFQQPRLFHPPLKLGKKPKHC